MNEAYRHYLSALEAAGDVYKADKVKGRIASVKVAVQFLREMKVDRSLIAPLYDVIGHLDDERLGRSGNSNPQTENAFMAAASVAVTFAMATGRKVGEAAAFVAKQSGLDAKKLKQFRKNLISGNASGAAEDLYNRMIDAANASGMAPDALLAKAIERLQEMRPS